MASGVSGYFDLAGNNGITLRVHYSETYDISTNKSNVSITSVQVKSSAYYGITYYLDGKITVNGSTAISMSSDSGSHPATLSTLNAFYGTTGTLGSVSAIAHNEDGTKAVTISVSVRGYTTSGGAGSGWSVSGSKSISLTTIPRKSTLTAANGTLGVSQNLTFTRQNSNFAHSLRYQCGSASGAIFTKQNITTYAYTPSLNLAKHNTTGTSVSITLILYTFASAADDAMEIGRDQVTITCSIPASVAPSCSVAVTDVLGHVETYGGYVQGQSSLEVVVTPTIAQSSPIVDYTVTAGGKTYKYSDIEIPYISTSGTVAISATVKDARGRTGSASKSITVLPYRGPAISKLVAARSGNNIVVTYSYAITSLSSKNTKTITLKYKKSTASSYTTASASTAYTATNATVTFAADTGASYDVVLTVADAFGSVERTTAVSTRPVVFHPKADGNGFGIGKMAETAGALDMGWNIQMNSHRINEASGLSIAAYSSGEETGDISFARPTNYDYQANIDVFQNALRIYRYDADSTYKQVMALGLAEGVLQAPYMRPSNPIGLAYGGTGAITASAARSNLGAFPATGGTATGNITIEKTDPYLYLKNSGGGGDNLGIHYYGTASGSNTFAVYDVKNARHIFEVYQSDGGGWFRGNLSVGGSVLKVGSQQQLYWNESSKSQTFGTNNATGGTNISCGDDATVTIKGAKINAPSIVPRTTASYNLGNSSLRWAGIYSAASVNVSSDQRLKRDIRQLDADELTAFVNRLKVVSYNYKDDAAERKARIGLVAQEVQQADTDLAKFFVDADEEGMLGLSPADFVFPLIASVQKLTKRIDQLEARLAELENANGQGKENDET